MVVLGYFNGIYKEVKKVVKVGVLVWVYVYNGMCGLIYWELGMVGVVYNLFNIYVEFICDGYYVDFVVCDILMI